MKSKYGCDIHKNLPIWDSTTQSLNNGLILFSIALFSRFSILLFKILNLSAKVYLEPSQTSKGLIIWRFSAQAEIFNSVKRIEKMILYGVFIFGLKFFYPGLNFLQEQFQKQACIRRYSIRKVFLQISQDLPEITCVRICFLIKLQASCLFKTS